MTSLVDEIMWEVPDDPWPAASEGRSTDADDSTQADPGLLPPPPPYGYRYMEGVGYHPYVSDPNPRALWRIYLARLHERWVPRSTAAHAAHARRSTLLRRPTPFVGMGVAAVVAVAASVLGATTPWAGSRGSGTTHIQRTSVSRSQTPGTTPPPTSPSGSGAAAPGSTAQPAPSAAPATLPPGLFASPPSTTRGGTSTAKAPPAARPSTGANKPATTSPAPTSSPSAATTPAPTLPATPATTNSAPPAPPSPDAQWWAANNTSVTQMQTDALIIRDALPNVYNSGNFSQAAQSCQAFLGEVNNEQAAPVVPDTNLYPTWQSGLSDYDNAAQECIAGANQQDNSLLGQALMDITTGLNAISPVVQTLSSAH